MQENRPGYRESNEYNYKPIDMNNEIKKVEDIEVGKYYQKEEILFVKITGGIGENKTGTAVYLLDNIVLITDNFTSFDIAEGDAMYREITREKFEQKLQATQDRFIEMSNKVKK